MVIIVAKDDTVKKTWTSHIYYEKQWKSRINYKWDIVDTYRERDGYTDPEK